MTFWKHQTTWDKIREIVCASALFVSIANNCNYFKFIFYPLALVHTECLKHTNYFVPIATTIGHVGDAEEIVNTFIRV